MADNTENKQSYMQIFKNGLIDENPTFIQLLGMCPTLATTTSLINAVGRGLSATFVLVCSNFAISLVRKCIPNKIRIASYIVIIATFVTIIQMLLEAYLPSISASLGLFIPLIVVNCIILARAENFASKNKPLPSAVDGLGMGLGFTLGLSVLGTIREILSAGTILGIDIFFGHYNPIIIFMLAPGGFLVFGTVLGIYNAIKNKKEVK